MGYRTAIEGPEPGVIWGMIVLFPLVGFWFWVAWVVFACWLFTAIYQDRYFQATLDVMLLAVLLSVTGNIHLANVWHFILHNPLLILEGVVGYLVIGVLWSLAKWRLVLRRFKNRLATHWKGGLGIDLPHDLQREGLRLLAPGKVTLDVDCFKTRIIGWMAYWWVSIPLWLVGDALHDLFEALYLGVRRIYQEMADSALND